MNNKKELSASVLIAIYLIVSIIGIVFVVNYFNGLITAHNNELTADIDSLIAEKMNRSIDYMEKSVDEMATVLSYQDLLELDQLYGQLTDSIPESDYISIGIIDQTGNVYGHESEKEEMDKWNLIELAAKTEVVSISEPYRSALTGKLVFTMFSPIYQQGERLGCIFVTYPLTEIQGIAHSAVMQEQTEIFLVNCYSKNMIICSGADEYLMGNWSSSKFMQPRIAYHCKKDYEAWEESMRSGAETGAVQFLMDEISYTQVFKKINAMEGWNVVVRIPNNTISNNIQSFRSVAVALVIVLLILSLLLLYTMHARDVAEKERFEYMSTHDALTGVYNRNAFDLVVQKYLDEREESAAGALIFLDIDYFKQINDNFGHDIGDKALIAFADMLNEIFEDTAILARYGGDEFVLLFKNMESEKLLNDKMNSLKDKLLEVKLLDYEDERFKLQYSAGIVEFPKYGKHFSDLVKCADIALYNAKEGGRNGYRWYKASDER